MTISPDKTRFAAAIGTHTRD